MAWGWVFGRGCTYFISVRVKLKRDQDYISLLSSETRWFESIPKVRDPDPQIYIVMGCWR